MKRVFMIWMALLCLFSLSLSAFAAETTEVTLPPVREPGQVGEDVYWELSEKGVLTITGTGKMDDFPESAPWAQFREDIREVILGDEITYIGAHAFEDLDELRSVTVGKALVEMGTAAFRSCDKLRELELPKTFKIFGEDCLRSCALMRKITFAGNFPKFKLNCLWDTTVKLIYSAKNPWPLEHIMALEEAFQGRIEFLSSDGTDPYITALDEEEATAPTTEPEETEPEETEPETEPTTVPTETPTVPPTTVPTEPAQATTEVTQPTEAPTQPPETLSTTAPTEPEAPRRSEGGGIGLAIVLGTLSLLMLGFLIFGRNPKGGGKYRR